MDDDKLRLEIEEHNGIKYYARIVLEEVVLELPKPPPRPEISKNANQYYRRQEIPDFWSKKYVRRQAEEKHIKTVFRKGKKSNVVNYEWFQDDALIEPRMKAWSEKEWKRRLQGHWFWNNGIAVYISGHHYYYLEYWTMRNGQRPEFRDRDWIWYHFWDMCELDGRCFGMIYPKMRREGATTKAMGIIHNVISSTANATGGIQSKKEPDAKKAFKSMIKAKRRMPLFFRMKEGGMDNPERELKYSNPSRRITHNTTMLDDDDADALESSVDYKSSKSEAYDQEQLTIYVHDEAGKIEVPGVRFDETWDTVRPAMEVGVNYANIVGNPGKAIIPTTVGKMDKQGGKYFEAIFKDSAYNVRNENGETHSGLYRLFLPAWFGHEHFYDRFGMSVVKNATPEQIQYLRKKFPGKAHLYENAKGSYEYFMNTREGFKKRGNHRALSHHIRQFPFTWKECFRSDTQDCHFDAIALDERIEELQFLGPRQPWVTGNLDWIDPEDITLGVEWKVHPQGRFKIAWYPTNSEGFTYNDVSLRGKPKPKNDHLFSSGLDPYDHAKIDEDALLAKQKAFEYGAEIIGERGSSVEIEFGEAGKFSKAAMYGFRKYDPAVDMGKDEYDWESHNFFMEYVGRTPEPEILWDDTLKFCWWCSVSILVENNKHGVINHFRQNDCEGFLLLKPEGITTSKKGAYKPVNDYGVSGSKPLHLAMLEETERFLEYHIHKNPFIRHLIDCRDLDIQKVTKFDAFVGSSLALIAARRKKKKKKRNEGKKRRQLAPRYHQKGNRSKRISA